MSGRERAFFHPAGWRVLMGVCLSLALVLPRAACALGEPEDVVIDFYTRISEHRCEEAAALARGYSPQSCRETTELKMGPRMERQIQQDRSHAVIKAFVEYRKAGSPKVHACEVWVPLDLEAKWTIDFPSLKTHCGGAADKPPKTAQEPAAPPRLPLAGAPPGEEPKARLPAHPAEPDESALLKLWRPEELRGRPGEERITSLPKPDFDPPEYLSPSESLPRLEPGFADSIRRVRLPPGKNLIALTFDLCEQADDVTGYDWRIVDYLRDNHIPATFFAGGKWMRSHPERAMQLMADGQFEIGNHGWTHGNLRRLGGQRMRDQIVWTQAEYERLWGQLDQKARKAGWASQMLRVPKQPAALRFPYGTCSAESLGTVNGMGLKAVQWDVVSGDAAPRLSPEVLARGVVGSARAGSIIVFHANGRGHGTAAALPRIVAALREKGLAFTTVSKLLQEGEPERVKECYEMRPGDNLYIDAKFGDGTQ